MSFSILGGCWQPFPRHHRQSIPPGSQTGICHQRRYLGVCHRRTLFHYLLRHKRTGFSINAKPTIEGPGFIEGFKIAFSNKPFILVTVIYMLSWLAIQFAQNNLQLYTKDWIKLDMSLFSFLLLAIQFSSFIWVLIWAKVSERIGKQNVYYLGVGSSSWH